MKDKISARLETQDRLELERRASLAGKSLSEFTAEIIHDALESKVRTDFLLQEMQENIVQLTGMMSIMQAYNTSVYTLLLSRSTPVFKSDEEKKVAQKNKENTMKMLSSLLSWAGKSVVDGENVWGTVKVENDD